MLELIPMTLREANAFVEQHHRHHKPVVGHKFSIGVSDGEKVVGVAIVGRPVGRFLDDGWTLEVTRLCTDGTHNACSMLYAAAWCDRRRGNVCCADCGFKSSGACKNPCLNGPDRCGQVLPRAKTNQTKNGRK